MRVSDHNTPHRKSAPKPNIECESGARPKNSCDFIVELINYLDSESGPSHCARLAACPMSLISFGVWTPPRFRPSFLPFFRWCRCTFLAIPEGLTARYTSTRIELDSGRFGGSVRQTFHKCTGRWNRHAPGGGQCVNSQPTDIFWLLLKSISSLFFPEQRYQLPWVKRIQSDQDH